VFVAMQKWLTTFIYYRLVDNKNHKLYLPKWQMITTKTIIYISQ
jgi:hypothetical protein